MWGSGVDQRWADGGGAPHGQPVYGAAPVAPTGSPESPSNDVAKPASTHRRAGAAAVLGVAAVGGAAGAAVYVSRQHTDEPADPETAWLDPDPALHLLRRTTYGVTPELLSEVRSGGLESWLDTQLVPERIDDAGMDTLLTHYPLLDVPARTLAERYAGDRRGPGEQLVAATMARQIWSRRQLLEVMTDFWSNHFNVTAPGGPAYATKTVEDATVIRAGALGSFEELLLADATSPAMLLHLDNASSRGDDPNENYGRELLELHTVGIGADYTEQDVRDSALALTGWGVEDRGTFVFTPENHYVGPLRVLGWTSDNADAAAGYKVGVGYLRYLARHRQTALHLSTKLAIRFVSDKPPTALVESLADAYLAGGTAIVPWLRKLLYSREFAASTGRKVRRPLEDLVATVRVLGIPAPVASPVAPMADLIRRARNLGHSPLEAAPPTGYPDVGAAWLSSSLTLGRWNEHRAITAKRVPGLDFGDFSELVDDDAPATVGEFVDAMTRRLTGQVFRSDHRLVLLQFLRSDAREPYRAGELAPDLPDLISLILDSPYHLMR